MFGCGWVVTLVTVLFMPEEQIWFGVLTLIGSCMLLMVPLEKLLRARTCGGWASPPARPCSPCCGT